MSQSLDVTNYIEQAVQEVLGKDLRKNNFRIGPGKGPLLVSGRQPADLALVPEEKKQNPGNPEDEDPVRLAHPLHRGSFAAKLLGGPEFFSRKILKGKSN